MPGYARQTGGSSKSLVFSNGTQAYSEKFYGLIFNRFTGNLSIITIPEEEGSYNDQYIYWIWSGTKLKFDWDDAPNQSRLIMEVT
jgi:hypothetical protein